MSCFELDARDAEHLVCTLPPRQELVYRLAVRSLRARCRIDRRFSRRTKALVEQFREDLPALLKEADKLSAELTASVRHGSAMPCGTCELTEISFVEIPMQAGCWIVSGSGRGVAFAEDQDSLPSLGSRSGVRPPDCQEKSDPRFDVGHEGPWVLQLLFRREE
jgi:hypothetical protein